MKISESEVILIVVLVLIGFVLYTQTGGAMKTTRVKKVGEKHFLPEDHNIYSSADDYFQKNKNPKQLEMCSGREGCRGLEDQLKMPRYSLTCGLYMDQPQFDQFKSNKDWDIPFLKHGEEMIEVYDGICRYNLRTDNY